MRFVFLHSWVFVTLALSSTHGQACPLTPPAALQGFIVSEDLRVNGVPTAIYQVRSADPAERVIQQTEREWKAEGYSPRRHRQGLWLIISAASEDCVSALQMQDATGSTGFLSVSRPQSTINPIDRATASLLPPGTEVTSSVHSKDHGRPALTLTVSAAHPNSHWSSELIRRLERMRWDSVKQDEVAATPRRPHGLRITARGPSQQFTAIVWGEQRTEAVITIAEPL